MKPGKTERIFLSFFRNINKLDKNQLEERRTMATGFNQMIAIGHLGSDSELRYTQKQIPVLSFRIACGERYYTAEKEWKERVEWIPCVLFGKRADGLHKLLQKGTRVQVTGSFNTRQYVGQDGISRTLSECRCKDLIILSTPEGRQVRTLPEELDDGCGTSTEE